MLMKPLPEPSDEHEAHGKTRAFAVEYANPAVEVPPGPGVSAGRVIARVIVGGLGLFIGGFLPLIVALGSGLIDVG